MKWQVKVKSKTYMVDLPSQILSGRNFEAQIAGTKKTLRWDGPGKTLFVLEKGSDGIFLERPISLRSVRSTHFTGESETKFEIEISGNHGHLVQTSLERYAPGQDNRGATKAGKSATIRSPITGKVLKVLAKEGETSEKGAVLLIIEAMKMENKIFAPSSGTISQVKVTEGQSVMVGQELMSVK